MDTNRQYNGSYTVLSQLLPRHYQIMDLYLSGQKAPDIAKTLNMSSRQIHNILKSPNFQTELAVRRSKIEDQVEESILKKTDAVQEQIKKNTLNAVNKLIELTDSENESVARQAANDILDRGGYPKTSRQENEQTSTLIIDDQQALLLEQALKEVTE